MPVISQFYGILIYMYRELGGHHKQPHIHVKYRVTQRGTKSSMVCFK